VVPGLRAPAAVPVSSWRGRLQGGWPRRRGRWALSKAACVSRDPGSGCTVANRSPCVAGWALCLTRPPSTGSRWCPGRPAREDGRLRLVGGGRARRRPGDLAYRGPRWPAGPVLGVRVRGPGPVGPPTSGCPGQGPWLGLLW